MAGRSAEVGKVLAAEVRRDFLAGVVSFGMWTELIVRTLAEVELGMA